MTRAPRYFAATASLGMLSTSGTLDEARALARERAKLGGECRVYQLGPKGIAWVETVYATGETQPTLFRPVYRG